jgi:mannose-6-phosphate isomerase-like protein (cupin superfamily)
MEVALTMPKAAACIALVLMLATGLTIGSLGALERPEPAAGTIALSSEAASRTATAFYQAIDLALETGDLSGLRMTVHPDYVDHAQVLEGAGELKSLETWLLALREALPGSRLKVSEVAARDDLVAVDLELTGEPVSTLAGLAVRLPTFAGGYELLRIEDARVIERWASPALPGLLEPSIANLDELPVSGWIREPRIERIELGQGSSLEVPSHEGTVLIVESGSPQLKIASSGTARGRSERLERGAVRTVEPNASFTIWTSGPVGANLVAVSVIRFEEPAYIPPPSGDVTTHGDATRRLLASGATIRPDHGPYRLEVGHAVAAPGTSMEMHKVHEVELLFVIEGTVAVTIDRGWVFSVSERSGLGTENNAATVGAGQAISAGIGADLSYAVTGQHPAEFWLVTITLDV